MTRLRNDRRRCLGVFSSAALLLVGACAGGRLEDPGFGRDELGTARPNAVGEGAITAVGDRMLAAGDADGAIGAYRRAATATGAGPDAMLRYAKALMAAGSANFAAGAYSELLTKYPRDPGALRGLGAALMAQGKIAEAKAPVEAAVREDPEARSIRALAVLRAMEGQKDEARAVYEKALAKWPRDLELRVNHALFEALAGDCAASDREGDAVITSPFVRPRHVGVRALAMAVCGREEEAERVAGEIMSGEGARALTKRASAVRAGASLADKAVEAGVLPFQGGDERS